MRSAAFDPPLGTSADLLEPDSGHYDNLTSGDVIFANASVATSSSTPLTYSASLLASVALS